MYFVNAYHSLHCVVSQGHSILMQRADNSENTLHQIIYELDNGLPLTLSVRHADHCLNTLKADAICHADDTPRTSFKEYPGHTGAGQVRMCRNWKKLEEWADQRSGCWSYLDRGKEINNLLRYRYCPKDSPYAAKVKQAMEVYGEDFDRPQNMSISA